MRGCKRELGLKVFTNIEEVNQMKKFGIKDQIGYVFGDLAGSMVSLYIEMFILTFSTYVLGISAQFMAALFLFSKFWGAVNDPMMGAIADKFRIGNSGDKYKPFIKLAMIPLAISAIICFLDVSSWSMISKQIWISVAYIFYEMCYTATSIPYGAMSSVITSDPDDRMKLSRARSIGGTTVGMLFIPVVSATIWNADQTPNAKGYLILGCVAAVASIVFYLVLLKFTTERINHDTPKANKKSKENNYKFTDALKGALKNRPLLGVMFATIGSLIGSSAAGTLSMYLYREYYHAPKVMAISTIVSFPIMLICFAVIPKISKKYSKKNVVLISLVYNIIAALMLYFFPIANPYVFLVLNTLAGIGQTTFMILTWAFVAECIDYQEYKTNQKADGTLYSIYTFSRKLGTTIASSAATYVLGAVGFISGVQSQAAGVGEGIRTLVTLAPVVACAIEIIGIGLIYNLTKPKSEVMYTELAERQKESEMERDVAVTIMTNTEGEGVL